MTDIAKALNIVMLPYKWRGKTYKTMDGLCRAVFKIHENSSISFDKDHMYVRNRMAGRTVTYAVERKPDVTIVADEGALNPL